MFQSYDVECLLEHRLLLQGMFARCEWPGTLTAGRLNELRPMGPAHRARLAPLLREFLPPAGLISLVAGERALVHVLCR